MLATYNLYGIIPLFAVLLGQKSRQLGSISFRFSLSSSTTPLSFVFGRGRALGHGMDLTVRLAGLNVIPMPGTKVVLSRSKTRSRSLSLLPEAFSFCAVVPWLLGTTSPITLPRGLSDANLPPGRPVSRDSSQENARCDWCLSGMRNDPMLTDCKSGIPGPVILGGGGLRIYKEFCGFTSSFNRRKIWHKLSCDAFSPLDLRTRLSPKPCKGAGTLALTACWLVSGGRDYRDGCGRG